MRAPDHDASGRAAESARARDDWNEANQTYLTAALEELIARLAGTDSADAARKREQAAAGMVAPPALQSIAQGFGLSSFEREVLLLCAGVELDSRVAQACAQAHGDPGRPFATFSLTMTALPDAHWSAIAPASALRRWHLIGLTHPELPTTSPLRVDERVLHALVGISYLDPQVECVADPLPAACQLPAGLREAVGRLRDQWAMAGVPVRLSGARPADLRAVTAAAANDLAGAEGWALRTGELPVNAADRDLLARLCERESVLTGRCWLLEIDDPLSESGRAAIAVARRLKAPVAIACQTPVDLGEVASVAVEVPAASPAELREAWHRALGPEVTGPGAWADRLAGQFALGIADIDAVAAQLAAYRVAGARDGDMASAAGQRAWAACRSRARPALDGLAQRVEVQAGWDELVLPGEQLKLLRAMVSHVRYRMRVFEDWGFSARTARGSGVAALFSGASGTGKTFAAEVLAHDLDLDLYQVDLSQVVSKYIGETEKNLRRIFDAAESGGVVLLFDEADALFGKRSEVKDSHDRYANIEVSYLLQRMESYRGLAILTTNLRESIDPAFLRRLRFIVSFPFPDAAGRADLWRRVFPDELPADALVPEKLARLVVSGGTIRNIALGAAFHAAAQDRAVAMADVLAATRTECAKLGKPLTDAEVAGWTT
jgi:hypothetical protein